ncbi:hypothetical protein ElyMa_001661100 [Elysia marginata]|uniref:Uncharacterized protein n=1 Tax=Elysia marginata TaxID=1093978 RepID=A0AAV4JQT3_9GAST|nr:hypothetical protein ElyMa_001661100 [Elysia marginata]
MVPKLWAFGVHSLKRLMDQQLHKLAMKSQISCLLVLACLCASTLAGGYGYGVMPFGMGLGLGGYGMGLGLGGLYGGYGMGLGYGGMYGGYGLGMGIGYPGMYGYGFGKYY